ncbi:MAG: recombinase family protein [Candidatus Magasanikbacteria bacterium]
MAKYILYARKSTDEEERQVLSIEAQLAELREFAQKEKLEIVASLCEAKTAKEPGRTVFGEMLSRISAGEADGILAWHPDRLARNPIDGGQVVYMVDTGKINSLKFPTFWFENTPQGKFMLNIAFGQSKYFIDNLSENIKRGLRQKLRRGEWPSYAPVGYLNDPISRNIIVDKTKSNYVKQLFEMYATGEYTLLQLKEYFEKAGLVSQTGKVLRVSNIQYILQRSIYCGVFKYGGEMYEGKHEPIITKKLFDDVQAVMRNKGRPHNKKNHEYIFASNLFNCSCGCCITAERQKGHVYYRCTKKKGPCDEKYIREELLTTELQALLQKVSLSDDWAEKMLEMLDNEKQTKAQSSSALVQSLESQLEAVKQKLDKLLDAHLEGTIDKAIYLKKKEQFISLKVTLEEQIKEILNKGTNWLEPMREFILSSCRAKKIAFKGDLAEIRTFLKNVGSNFVLKGKKIEFLAKRGWRILAENPTCPTLFRD